MVDVADTVGGCGGGGEIAGDHDKDGGIVMISGGLSDSARTQKPPSGMSGQQRKGSFWWHEITKLIDMFKRVSAVQVGNGSTVLLWHDSWNGTPLKLEYPELFSFVKKENMLLSEIRSQELIFQFHLPLTIQAFEQLTELHDLLANIQLQQTNGIWKHMGQTVKYSTSRVYKQLIGHMPIHPAFNWLWMSTCEPKHKCFFGFSCMIDSIQGDCCAGRTWH
ncbi:hypothetical protein EJB05_09708, partial [Eragrostis curvula]